jgi:uncharacterized domain HDIG
MEKIAKHNIYSKNGKLLLAKGNKITTTVMNALGKYGDSDIEQPAAKTDSEPPGAGAEIEQSGVKINEVSGAINNRINTRYHTALEYPSELLKSIIFDSRNEPWWIFINALANYVEWVYEHSIDVALISALVGMQFKLSKEDLWKLSLGALLHDVGKILIPKNIIQKQGSLNEEEWFLVHQHCELGAMSLGSYNLPAESLQIVREHHERLDGSGYPAGLKGHEIHPFAKIVMVADAIDAITSYRPYKEISSMEEAIKFLKHSKSQYPYKIVKIIENMFL